MIQGAMYQLDMKSKCQSSSHSNKSLLPRHPVRRISDLKILNIFASMIDLLLLTHRDASLRWSKYSHFKVTEKVTDENYKSMNAVVYENRYMVEKRK